MSTRPARNRHARAAPKPVVVAAAEFLLAESDAHVFRRRYLELLTHTTAPDGATVTDYTVAERYLLNSAAKRRAARRPANP